MGILLWPFKLVFWLTGLALSLCGKLITIILGLAVCALGLMLCATLIGLWLGIPLAILGISLIIKGVLG